ncbi:MAG: hypothetical protein D6682_05950 [Zetaproteobacteria bacterium]|nr:MAG: hypothetical protein D6682_05950 [Zetaproteobacteria bacterium]
MTTQNPITTQASAAALLLAAGISLGGSPALAGSLSDKLDNLDISGFVDSSYSGQNSNAAAVSSGFGLDQVELDVAYHKVNVGFRFDLNGFPSAGGTVQQNSLFEQGFVHYTFNGVLDEGITFTFGKFNAPIGWELLDAPDMYQFSHAMVFHDGLPTNLTGASIAGKLGMVDAVLYYSNKVDSNGVSTSGIRAGGGRIGITPMDGVNLGISYLRQGNPGLAATRTLDIDFSYNAIDHLTIGAEYNQVKTAATATTTTKSGGYFITAHYDFTDMLGATYRFGTWDNDTTKAGKATSNTVAVTTTLGEGFGALGEYRTVNNTMATATPDGFAANFNTKAYAFEMTYSF